MEKEYKRLKLIKLLNIYIQKPKTGMKQVMVYYKNILLSGENLKPSHFDQLIPWLKKDLKMKDHHLRIYFKDQIGNKPESAPVTLEKFFK